MMLRKRNTNYGIRRIWWGDGGGGDCCSHSMSSLWLNLHHHWAATQWGCRSDQRRTFSSSSFCCLPPLELISPRRPEKPNTSRQIFAAAHHGRIWNLFLSLNKFSSDIISPYENSDLASDSDSERQKKGRFFGTKDIKLSKAFFFSSSLVHFEPLGSLWIIINKIKAARKGSWGEYEE